MQRKRRPFSELCRLGLLICGASLAAAQEPAGTGRPAEEETVRVETRVVFIDALVKDKRTGVPAKDLTRGDFQVFDNGKPRQLDYFGREGERRRPLAMIICLNLDPAGAGRYLGQDAVRASLAAALTKLSPEDEVAVMTVWETMGGKPSVIADLTRDRAKAVAALSPPPGGAEISSAGRPVSVMTEATRVAVDIATRARPDSQVAFVYVSDGFATNDLLQFDSRRNLVAKLIESNVIFSALTFDMLGSMGAAAAIGNVPLRILGASITGGEKHLARETGGVAVEVDRPEDLGSGLQQITSDLASRYSLGFILGENEQGDGRIRRLEVKVKARDSRGKERKLQVSARRGYFIPKR